MFTDYYDKLANLNFDGFRPKLVATSVISHEENQIIQRTIEPSRVASIVLDNIVRSLRAGVTLKFDKFLTILENDEDVCCNDIANQMRGELSENTSGTVTIA